jgi:putative ABC transport system permease protein
MSAVAALLRRSRVERGVVLVLFVLVAVTSLVVAVSPRLFERAADEGLRYEVRRGTAIQRNLMFSTIDRIRPGDDDPTQRIVGRGVARLERVPPSVRDVVASTDYVFETPRFGLVAPPNFTTYVTMRYQDGVADRLAFAAGRTPAALPPPVDPAAAVRFEIALSADTARAVLVEVGDVLPASLDPNDPMVRPFFPRPSADVEFEVVGLFDVADPLDPAWFDDPAYDQAAIGGTLEVPIAFATALIAPSAYEAVFDLGLPSRYEWRHVIDVERLDADRLETLVPDLHRLDTAFGTNRGGPGSTVYRSGLLEAIERYAAQRAASAAVLSVAALGPLAVAAGALALVAVVIIRRRRSALTLSRDRGASSGQLLAAQFWEGLVITVPAAIAGLLAARIAVPARSDPVSSTGAVLVAIAVTVLLLLATWSPARRARRDADRDDAAARRPGPRRFVFEATVVAVAFAAAWLLRERGLGDQRADGASADFDPFLAAAPVLIGIATALLTIRLYPLPVRALAWSSAHRRDLIPSLGLRSIGRDPGAAYLPLLVVTLTVAIGVFSSVIASTIERGQTLASWQETGADYRFEAAGPTGLPSEADLAAVPGVEAVASGSVLQTSTALDEPDHRAPTTLVAIDLPAYEAVLAGSPVERTFPAAMTASPSGSDAGTPAQPIPVSVSRRLPNDWAPLAVGETLRLRLRDEPVSVVVVDLVDDLPGMPRAVPFVLAPLASLTGDRAAALVRPTFRFVRGPASIERSLRAAAPAASVELTSRHAVLEAQRGAPLVSAIGAGFGLAVAAAAVYAALAIAAAITLDSQRRARELAYLRTLGLTSRQSVWLTFVEHAPPTLLALGVGVALGLGVAWLLAPGLGIGAFIGPAPVVRLQVDWLAVASIATIVFVAIVVMVGASSWSARRLDQGQALRIGDA